MAEAEAGQSVPEFTSYFDYQVFPPTVPPLSDGREEKRHQVVIVGGGPIGLAQALDLARFGIPCVVIEADDTVCTGSRAGCVTRRTMDLFDQLKISEPTMTQGLPWNLGQSFYGTTEIYRMEVPEDPLSKFPSLVNIQQCYVEKYMVDEIESQSDLIDLRWQSRVTRIENSASGVRLTVDTPDGPYEMQTDWLIACDGARGFVRKSLGLKYVGTHFEDAYIIIDIKMKSALPPGRRAWFNPPSNPGATLLMHKQRDDIWRFDYQIKDGEDPEEAAKPENVCARIQDHLDLIGETAPWSPVWISTYKAMCMSLESYRHNRILFAGDAAHLVPIFGVRGMNSGVEDIDNLAWKLSLVLQGKADEKLINTYSLERHEAMRENMRQSCKSAEFMAPPSKAFKTMRDAVLALSDRHEWITMLVDWRTSSPVGYPTSPLNRGTLDVPPVGQYLRDVPLVVEENGQKMPRHLSDIRGKYFTLLSFGDTPNIRPLEKWTADGFLKSIAVEAASTEGWQIVEDPDQIAQTALQASKNTLLLIRPDGFLLAAYDAFDAAAIDSALKNVLDGGTA